MGRVAGHRPDLLLLLSLAGVVIAGYLTFVALDREAEAFCTGVGDCHRVQQSEYATVAGVPVPALGLAMYGGLVALLLLRRFRIGPLRALEVWTFALALSGTLYSAYLTYLELFVIDAICIWCIASATLVSAICLLAWPDLRGARAPREGALRAARR